MKQIYAFIILILTTGQLSAQMVAKSEAGPFLLRNATIHTITSGDFTGDLYIKDDKIVQLGVNLRPDGKYTTIDCSGKHIYPGMIDAGTQLGLSEIESISVTNDFNEVGDLVPQMQALTAVNPNAVTIPVTRTNGITTVLVAPKGGRFPGTAAVIDLHGYTPEQMNAGFEGVVMNFPSSGRRGRWDRRSDEDIKKDSEKALKKLDEIWADAVLYAKIDSAASSQKTQIASYQPEMEALKNVVNKKTLLLVEVNKSSDILLAIDWIKKTGVKAVLTGVSEGYRVAPKIAEAGLAVITGPVLDTPRREYDKYDAPYTNAAVMFKAGIKVAIRTDEAENVRNLPFNAGFAAAYGLGKEEALRAITIVPAEILGMADRYGSIEPGKVANLLICNGDPLETKTIIDHLFIRGWKIPMENRHTLLYDEFLKRSPGLK
ncbi:MAG: amidohydrolase family protein [Saprospiraceae bacterium]|nr:amidohydrolase family protein [Saprospiraceae bacterium]MBK8848929.1 amidohydrolase family protein [Saprospiraceae bacterium]